MAKIESYGEKKTPEQKVKELHRQKRAGTITHAQHKAGLKKIKQGRFFKSRFKVAAKRGAIAGGIAGVGAIATAKTYRSI
jgi:hypothetical protein